MFRVRGFTQDDAHIYCSPTQITSEIVGVLQLTFKILQKFHFNNYQIMLSTRPIGVGNSIGKIDDALLLY